MEAAKMRSKTNKREAPERYEHGEIDDILVENKQGQIITQSDIQRTIDIYINGLRDPESIYNNKPMIFNGLLEAIYRKNIKYILPNTYNLDYELLDSIFINIYINLCYTFSYIPSVLSFCNHLVKIEVSGIYTIQSGFYRPDGSKINNRFIEICKKWESFCTSDLFDNIAHNNSVGCIFIAKVKGYTDQPQPAPQINVTVTPSLDEKMLEAIRTGTPGELPPLPPTTN
jgi:hypothetical protein